MKRNKPFAGMTLSYDYGQFYISAIEDCTGNLDVGSKKAAKRGFSSSKDERVIAVLPRGGIGIATLSFYISELPDLFYKKQFCANLNLQHGEIWLSAVDGGYTFFPIESGRYRLDFGLIRSEEFGGISRNDYDIALTRIDIEQDGAG